SQRDTSENRSAPCPWLQTLQPILQQHHHLEVPNYSHTRSRFSPEQHLLATFVQHKNRLTYRLGSCVAIRLFDHIIYEFIWHQMGTSSHQMILQSAIGPA